jgi:formylglycine-generating enzyme required for sulfatase activity
MNSKKTCRLPFILITTLLLAGCIGKPVQSNPTATLAIPSPSNTPAATLSPIEIPTNTPLATTTPTLGIGSTWTGIDGMTLLYVPEGEFIMGSNDGAPNEKPVHTVYLDAYWIDQTEVTDAMYKVCVQSGKCAKPSSADYYGFTNYPVVNVNWNDAASYCSWAGRRLPTEAEWEKAARGTDGRTYPWGNEPPNDNLLNYNQPTRHYRVKVGGSYPDGASPYGAYDMAGNVWEWVNDKYSETYYQSSLPLNPTGPDSGENRVIRGGAWNNDDSGVRSAYRLSSIPTDSLEVYSFRCASNASPALPTETNTPISTPNAKPLPDEISDSKGLTMRLVPAGTFTMGEDSGIHEVYLDTYYMDIYEVTNAAYKSCVNNRECEQPKGAHYNDPAYADHPVVYVNWGQANAYCEWRGARLPTEAEWEKAARGTDGRTYPWGEESGCAKANICEKDTTAVGSYESGKSPYGMYDMIGNVNEWASDWYSETYYQNSPSSNPLGSDSGNSKVVRGGSWAWDRNSGYHNPAWSAARWLMIPESGHSNIGFRCARSTSP